MNKDKNSTKLPDEITTTPGGQSPADSDSKTKDIIPDEVPRKNGPEGEGK